MRTTIRIEVKTDELFGALNKRGISETYKGHATVNGDFETVLEVVQDFLKHMNTEVKGPDRIKNRI